MDESKTLVGLDQDDYTYPLADVSSLTDEEKNELLRRGMRIPKELKSDYYCPLNIATLIPTH